ncbi:MAG: alpha/beta family hydrolase [Verrucomicrobiota bacterium]
MKPFFLFAPGAGASSLHPWMQRWKALLGQLGKVETFDYDYVREGRRRPDSLPRLIEAHRSALAKVRPEHAVPIVLIGKSMGGRIGCHVSLVEKISGLICLGYPLCGGGDPDRLRDAVLRELKTPILFVQGTRDALCPLELLEKVRREMEAPNFLYRVEEGDHSLEINKMRLQKRMTTQAAVDAGIQQAIAEFTARLSA